MASVDSKILSVYLTGLVLLIPHHFANFASVEFKTHKFGSAANALARWCTSWCHQLRACVSNPDINSRGIMCLLDNVVFGIQAPREEPLDETAAR